MIQDNLRALFGLTGQRHAQSVKHESLRQTDDLQRYVPVVRLGDVVGDFLRETHKAFLE